MVESQLDQSFHASAFTVVDMPPMKTGCLECVGNPILELPEDLDRCGPPIRVAAVIAVRTANDPHLLLFLCERPSDRPPSIGVVVGHFESWRCPDERRKLKDFVQRVVGSAPHLVGHLWGWFVIDHIPTECVIQTDTKTCADLGTAGRPNITESEWSISASYRRR